MLTRLIVGLVVIKVTGRAARLLTAHAYAAGMRCADTDPCSSGVSMHDAVSSGLDACRPCSSGVSMHDAVSWGLDEVPPGYGPR